jgi:hypothetical protein
MQVSSENSKIETYHERATNAERMAQLAKSRELRESYQRVASNWRRLAEQNERLSPEP